MDKYAIASNAKNTPMKGILLKVSGNTVGRPSIVLPTNSEPIKPERPVPKIVKARPVATWFVASPKTKNRPANFQIYKLEQKQIQLP